MKLENEVIRAGPIEIRFLLESKDSNGQLAMFEFTVPAGAKVPAPHSHTHYDESIYGLEGALTLGFHSEMSITGDSAPSVSTHRTTPGGAPL